MGSHCSFCKDSSDTKMLEVEEQKRERIKIQTVLNDEDHLSLRSFSIHSNLTPKSSPLNKVARRYLTLKYFKTIKILNRSDRHYKLLFGPIPMLPDENKDNKLKMNINNTIKDKEKVIESKTNEQNEKKLPNNTKETKETSKIEKQKKNYKTFHVPSKPTYQFPGQ